MRRTLCVAVALGCAAVGATPSHAQILRGQVVDDDSSEPVSNAHIALFLRNSTRLIAEADADSLGRFRVLVPEPQTYRIRIERLGYQTVAIDSFDIGEDREMVVEFRMGLEAIPIEPVRVLGNSRYDWSRLKEYYDRMERNKRLGIGDFITREEVEAQPAAYVTELLRGRVPTLQVVGRDRLIYFSRTGRECMPDVYIDGILTNRSFAVSPDEYLSADLVEGIEVYRGLTQMPGEYVDTEDCGVVLVWTRRGFEEGRPFSWKRMLVAGGVTGLLFMILR